MIRIMSEMINNIRANIKESAKQSPVVPGRLGKGKGWIYASLFFTFVLIFPLLVLFFPLPSPLLPGIASLIAAGGLKFLTSRNIPSPTLSRAPPF